MTLSVSTSRTATLALPAAGAALERRGLDATDRGTAAVDAIELIRNVRLFMRDVDLEPGTHQYIHVSLTINAFFETQNGVLGSSVTFWPIVRLLRS
jgi:hypothetical protein